MSAMIIIDGKTLKFREVLLIALTDMFITFLLVNSDQCLSSLVRNISNISILLFIIYILNVYIMF